MDLKDRINKCTDKVKRCQDFDSLFMLEEDFNSVGLTLRETVNRKMALCRVEDGSFASNKMLDDFIFVGYADDPRALLLDEMRGYICEFVDENASDEELRSIASSAKHQQVGLYGRTITQIENEDVLDVVQRMGLECPQLVEEGLLESVRKWLEDSNAEI